jgi:hypothetical protein
MVFHSYRICTFQSRERRIVRRRHEEPQLARQVPELDQHEVIFHLCRIAHGSAAVKITVAQIDEMRAKLAALPAAPAAPTQPATKMEAVTALAPELVALRERGWGLHALAAFMTEGGFPISPGTLKNYLQRAEVTRTKRRRKKQSTPSGATGPTSPVEPSAAPSPAASTSQPVAERAVVTPRTTSYGTFVLREDTEL